MNAKILCLFGLFIFCFHDFAEGRQKRVVDGEELRDRSTASYAALKYFVWIGFGRQVSEIFDIILFPREWTYQRQVCGGALITPRILQTACHCFCEFLSSRNGYGIARRNDHFFEVVAGWNVVVNIPQPIGIDKYHIHEKCAIVYWTEFAGFITHDFALARLEISVQLTSIVKPAPWYPLRELAETWSDISAKEAVCLVIGFGRWIGKEVPEKSTVLRHGWNSVTSYRYCYDLTRTSVNMTRYQKDASWSCMVPFGPKTVFAAKGDSGSPVSCDNIYFSIVSGTGLGADVFDDLVYYAFANSLEYRKAVIDLMDPSKDLQPPSVDPPGRWTPGTAPPNVFVAASSGYALIDHISLLPFYVTLVVYQN